MAKDLMSIVKDSIAAGMKEVEAKKAKLNEKRSELEQQLAAINTELLGLDSQLRTAAKEAFTALGISLGEPAKARKAGGTRHRMSTEDIDAMRATIVSAVEKAKDEGTVRSEINIALANAGIEASPATVSKTLADLAESKKIRKSGSRKDTRYFAA